jgi:cell division protein FtsI/penicillin-binding protein 2
VSAAAVEGYRVGGKTGTAETGSGGAHSWFIGFIGDDDPRYAVAVVLEEGSGGLADAVGIGREVLVATIEGGAAQELPAPASGALNPHTYAPSSSGRPGKKGPILL